MEWKDFWMNQKQNSQADYKNYFNRAFGVDANMAHNLSERMYDVFGARINALEAENAELKEALKVISEIGKQSDRCVYEAESFMADVANKVLGLPLSEPDWDDETYVYNFKSRFNVDVESFWKS